MALPVRCLTQTLEEVESELGGILIALCCHHRCDWSPYVGKEFLTEQGEMTEDRSDRSEYSMQEFQGSQRKILACCLLSPPGAPVVLASLRSS